ncbi:transketolase-like TK C-terminal-containing protein [Microbacterium sp. ASV49]|uniref:Pyruvate dehydrogenase E1 component n=1 Tax=Microbacterium candidum TaxID=3041922 RepID=A0ABT7MW73_9MICO|nr:transketolase C-terminal domain-containing protein [Microbacterium sp. ASV49]MDL9978692.1 transketolase C-terminal domain-containing protein [Microbacterium sp. ASV49]
MEELLTQCDGVDEGSGLDEAVLVEVERKVLWLATAMIDAANAPDRKDPDGLKVGGHQASSASIATIMTALWFTTLTADDRVSVKPHASPVLHAINYLLGELDAEQLGTLRGLHGLQSYPSRTKDPDTVDYSTGSVGIGATAPVWGAVARRYAADTAGSPRSAGRQYSLVGDAELDEGAVWEAVLDQTVGELGELVWIVDFNRQSLDRVVPNISATRLQAMFHAAGWQVLTLKYGRLLTDLFESPGGHHLERRIDEMSNPEYQRLLRCSASELRDRLPGAGEGAVAIRDLLDGLDDAEVTKVIHGLAGHDIPSLVDAFRAIDDTRPTVIFAYTIKGNGLATAGHPQNHSALLKPDQLARLANELGENLADPWRRFADGTDAAALCVDVARRLRRTPAIESVTPRIPQDFGRAVTGHASTQQALGRLLLDLTRLAPDAARRVVTVAPDVASSTNLGGWVNKAGVWSPTQKRDWFADDTETILHWDERPSGQHIELGIAEVNLVSLLGELGATWSRWGEPLLPIGTLYDPFVTRALEPWSFGVYGGGQSILVGTPSGVTLAAEGGAHQSIITPSVGIEQPGVVAFEPAFVQDFEWCMLEALSRLGRPGGSSSYFRLTSRSLDQSLAAVPSDPAARERRRRQVVGGAYALRRVERPAVTLVGMGALMREVLVAADRLAAQGIDADVVCVTSADRLYRAARARGGRGDGDPALLEQVFPASRVTPVVTVLDGHPHTLAFVAAIRGVPSVNLGVTEFGQTGTLQELYRLHGIGPEAIVTAALDLTGH